MASVCGHFTNIPPNLEPEFVELLHEDEMSIVECLDTRSQLVLLQPPTDSRK